MSKFEFTREDVKNIAADSLENLGLILDLLFDLRDILTPKLTIVNLNSDEFPNDLGSCVVEFCTDKSARITFDRKDLGTLFVPFSRMPQGVREACVEGVVFQRFYVGDWIYDRLLETAVENAKAPSEPDGLGVGNDPRHPDDDIPF